MANRFAGRKMGKIWSTTTGTLAQPTADATLIGGTLGFAEARTILRVIGSYLIHPTSAPAALDVAKIAVAIGVVSSDAFTLGPTAMPDPAGEPDYPWLYWEEVSLGVLQTGATHADALGAGSYRSRWDSKAMRKVKPGQTLALVIQPVDIIGNPTMEFMFSQTRVLLGSCWLTPAPCGKPIGLFSWNSGRSDQAVPWGGLTRVLYCISCEAGEERKGQ